MEINIISTSAVDCLGDTFDVIPEYKIRTFFDNQNNPIGYLPESFSAIKLVIPEIRKQKLKEDVIIERLRKIFIEEKSGHKKSIY